MRAVDEAETSILRSGLVYWFKDPKLALMIFGSDIISGE